MSDAKEMIEKARKLYAEHVDDWGPCNAEGQEHLDCLFGLAHDLAVELEKTSKGFEKYVEISGEDIKWQQGQITALRKRVEELEDKAYRHDLVGCRPEHD